MQIRKTDLFTFIHKSIRSMIYNSGSMLQTADFGNAKEAEKIIASLESDLELLHEHAVHEDHIIFPEIAHNEPEMIKMLNEEHKDLEDKLNRIKELLETINKTSNDVERLAYGSKLNAMFNDFAVSYLAHMSHEETTVLDASFKYLTDDELIAIRTRIQTQIPTERYKIWLSWMLRSLNNSELIALLGGMKAGAPPQIFNSVIETAKSIINNERFDLISDEIGLRL